MAKLQLVAINYNAGTMWAYDRLRNWLEERDVAFILANCANDSEVIAHAQNADIFLAYKYPITRNLIQALPNLKLLMSSGTGYDHIDVAAASDHGVIVTNAPLHNVEDVAEHSVALILACARKLIHIERAVLRGEWRPNVQPVQRLRGKIVGLVGFGNIAKALNWRLQGLGLRVLVYSRSASEAAIHASGAQPTDFETLLTEADFVSLHLISTTATRLTLRKEHFALMKPTAFVINTSRGDLIDEPALIDALQTGEIAGAGLDVLMQEPPDPQNPLLRMDQVIISGHSAASTLEATQDWVQEWLTTLGDYLEGYLPSTIVNTSVQPRSPLKTKPENKS